eukprot:5600514-Ditylum_brightwellii.AAC.1
MIGDGSVPIGLGIRVCDAHIYDGVGLRSPQAADTEIAVKIAVFGLSRMAKQEYACKPTWASLFLTSLWWVMIKPPALHSRA